ncbi:hypothetical protein FJK98_08845 [Micromonospora sp. HM134]|uniref:hypothetical protein n=1 Tax=unclassified Micromonospora TaxID=2617518 RepID=UPI0011989177|nr:MULTISPECIES: hypothetical protein [unclassified Micromonospora]QDY07269.1 hypothetical protein FJK98_08845 [Micromonospora sp. HM134]
MGRFSADLCRCPGDLTIALYDADAALLGSASVHPGSLSWERNRFGLDLLILNSLDLELCFAKVGVQGASRSLLGQMIDALDLHEGEIQFRRAADPDALVRHRVPEALYGKLSELSGDQAAGVDQEAIDNLMVDLRRSETGDAALARQILAWLGTATWPAEAIAGDGQLARRLLAQLDPEVVETVLPSLSEPAEIMGGVVWAAHQSIDAPSVVALGPAIKRILS